jgi:phospholipase C
MGHFDGSRFFEAARNYLLLTTFHGAFGGSFLNHQRPTRACSPRFPDAPDTMRVQLAPDGKLEKPGSPKGAVEVYVDAQGGQVSPDGYAVNTTQPPYQPSGVPPEAGGNLDLTDPRGTEARGAPLPPQNSKTIGDTLSAKGVSWTWYAGGWSLALADGRQPPQEKRKIIYTERVIALLRAASPAIQLF